MSAAAEIVLLGGPADGLRLKVPDVTSHGLPEIVSARDPKTGYALAYERIAETCRKGCPVYQFKPRQIAHS
jgi:hypothetical protein